MNPLADIALELKEIAWHLDKFFGSSLSPGDWVQIAVGILTFFTLIFIWRSVVHAKTAAQAAGRAVELQEKLAKESLYHELIKTRYSSDLSIHMITLRNFINETEKKGDHPIRKYLEERNKDPLSDQCKTIEDARRYVKWFYRMIPLYWKRLDGEQQGALGVPAEFFFEIFQRFEVPGLTADQIPSKRQLKEWEKKNPGKEYHLFKPVPEPEMARFYNERLTSESSIQEQ